MHYKNVGFIDRVDNETLQDDAGDFFRRASAQKMMNVLFSSGRHPGISLICAVQSPQHLSPIQKSNTTEWIIFRCNPKSMWSLAEQLQTRHSFTEEEHSYLIQATENRYSFAYMNTKETEKGKIYRYGFE
ncbi:hypothetical protein HDU90_004557 [Geranomyces variabilis]|nr:hypothetical protein HDU90_004557 [Geranomyces variabilis]